MAKFSQLFPWLRTAFPPAEARGFQPSEVSEDVSLVHDVFQGTDFLDKALSVNVVGTAGSKNVDAPSVADGFYWYVIACGIFHDDPVARESLVVINGPSTWPLVSAGRALPTNIFLPVPRAFILPTHENLRGNVPALAAGQKITIRALYFRISLGRTAVPSP